MDRAETRMKIVLCTITMATGADRVREVASTALRMEEHMAVAMVEVINPPVRTRILVLPCKGTMTTMICGDLAASRGPACPAWLEAHFFASEA
jgi:hypothetical protein